MKRILTILALLWAVAAATAQEAYTYNAFYYQRATIFDELPVDSTDIVMLGNSLTNGCEWHELLGMPNVKNRGISSDVIAGISDRLDSVIKGQPAKIFLMTGTNDVSHDLSVDSIVTAYTALIDKIRDTMPRTRLYVQSMLPINITFGMYKKMTDKDQTIRDVNARLAEIVPTLGATWIDLYPTFADDQGHLRREFTNDGIHLLGPGYLAWRDRILPYISE